MSFSNTWPVTELATPLPASLPSSSPLFSLPCQQWQHGFNFSLSFEASLWCMQQLAMAQLPTSPGPGQGNRSCSCSSCCCHCCCCSCCSVSCCWDKQLIAARLAAISPHCWATTSEAICIYSLGHIASSSRLPNDGFTLGLTWHRWPQSLCSLPPSLSACSPTPGCTSCVANKCGQISVQTAAIKALYELSTSPTPTPTWLLMSLLKLKFLISSAQEKRERRRGRGCW